MTDDAGEKLRLQNYLNSVAHDTVKIMDGVNSYKQRVVVLDIRQTAEKFSSGSIIALTEEAAERLRQLLNNRKENEKP